MDTTTKKPIKVEQMNENQAKETVKLVYEGKQLTKYIPPGQSPKLYIDLVKSQVMKPDKNGKPRSDADLLLFLYVAKRTGLDPLTKQIYAVFRWDSRQAKEVMAIQAGIDGFRLVAQRTGDYAGQDDAIFTPIDESTEFPQKASVTVYKVVRGARVAFSATARWSEYAPLNDKGTPEFMWKKMPYTMLAKCAEALALRKGFPNELSGIYTDEEMRQAVPDEKQLIASLPAPEKKEIVVEHGAPEDESQAPKVTPGNIDQFSDRLIEKDSPEEQEQIEVKIGSIEPNKNAGAGPAPSASNETDIVASREKLRGGRTVEEMQARALEIGKEVAAKNKKETPKEEPKQEKLISEGGEKYGQIK